MTIVSLDTSAINNLVDDPESPELTTELLRRYDVYISALNILEIAKTKDAVRREQLRHFAKRIGGTFEPLDLPNHLVRQTCRLFSRNDHRLIWSVCDERRAFWVAMSQANSLGEEERTEALGWADRLEGGTSASNASLRTQLEGDVFSKDPAHRPQSAPHLLRLYLKAKWPLRYELTAQIFKRETDRVLPLSRLDDLLSARPSIWPLYLMAYAFSIYYGAIWTTDFGARNPAGFIDLLYAVYLPACDVFVTHDTRHGGQYDALRVLNAFNSRRPRTKVLNWKRFRNILLGAG